MRVLVLSLIVAVAVALPARAETARPWWVERAFVVPNLKESSTPDETQGRAAPMALMPSVLSLIDETADRYGIDARLFRALTAQESAYDPSAIGADGEIGLGQLMPVIHRWCGIDPFHRAENLDCAARFLSDLLMKYGDEALALAAYNAGEPAVDRAGGMPAIVSTRAYVARILAAAGREASPGRQLR